jgi:serine/threonine protein kinase/tetratricopeptide (TPR) repeat protein
MSDPPGRLTTALADRYRIERELGVGGMATVYVAEDVRHRRRVAVKVLKPELAAALGAERFLREIETTANLRHPHILPLYDSGEAGGFLYYVMPLIEGESLRDRLSREKPLPIEDALQIAKEVAEALGYAHARGVIHRDIKPENILLEGGHAVVADFGIAKAVSGLGGAHLTQTGLAVGTPAYMSPEQVLADGVDGRSDLYSLGCMLHEMLTGETPFAAPTVQRMIARRLTESPPACSASRPEVGAQLSGVVQRILATDPAQRPANAAELVKSLLTPSGSTWVAAAGGRPAPARAAGLVVLPFVNRSPDSGDEYFSDGLTEEIISDLASIKALSVISRTSAMRFKGSDKDVRTIGRELGVRYVLEGSVRKAGSSLRITAQLIDAEADSQLWSEKYGGTLDDVFEVQERVSREIVKALGVKLSNDEDRRLAARPIQNARAFELYLEARAVLRRLGAEMEHGKDLVRQAIEIEGPTAPLLGLLAWADVSLVKAGIANPAILAECAVQADALLAMAPDAPYGHALHGYISFERGHHPEAVRHFRAALEREPNDADSLFWLTVTYWQAGYMPGAEATSRQMMASDPLSPMSWLASGVTPWFAGRFEGGPETLRRAVEVDPQGYVIHWTLGYNYALVGDVTRAAEEAAWLTTYGPMVPYTWQLQSLVASLQGDRPGALAALAPVNTAPLDFHLTFHLAESYAMAGETARALLVVEEAVDKGFYAYEFMSTFCPFMAPLRGMPEYARIMEKARGRWEAFAKAVAR